VLGEFLEKFTEVSKAIRIGDPFGDSVDQGPMSSQAQFDRIMGYIASGKEQGATVHTGGERLGAEGYYIMPTVFTDIKPEMKIVKEEIFGPVGVVIKFEDGDGEGADATATVYGLAAGVFTQNIDRAIRMAHRLQAGSAWVNCYHQVSPGVTIGPFGGYKQSGNGRELGEQGVLNYTNVKAVHVNLGHRM
ncbi:aldehyde dehydrogenase domain-containing protein, partial [Mycena crocata]